MIRAALSVLSLSVAVAPTLAQAQAQDSRLLEVMYNEAKVFRLDGRINVQASIVFGDDEVIENVAIGDSQSWQVTPNKRQSILFVKPLAPRATTNMTVVTSKRTYLFDLVASPANKPLYVMRFDYPPEPQAETRMADAVERKAVEDPYAVVDPTTLNFAWSGSGEAELLPGRAFDDGEATFLTWPEGRAVPAILVANAEGTEGPVNFAVRDDTIILDSVPRRIVLRAGKDSAILVNSGPERPIRTARDQAALASAVETK
ncbi:MAG: TrbG/VirB9 family P-type conjugative transfer protein [Qipengyuania sp.]